MCGIVGYIGKDQACHFLIEGLKKLEYRGYDSAGVAVYGKNGIEVIKSMGKIANLEKTLNDAGGINGNIGIGHTRWATHGKPSMLNSHPHVSTNKKFSVVHNGIIENYKELKDFLVNKGKVFVSQTDTEVIPQLLEYNYDGDFLSCVQKTVKQLKGSYAIAILCDDYPNTIVAAKKDSPLIIGLGDGENYIASDIPAILSKTRNIIRLNDKSIAVINKNSVSIYDEHDKKVDISPTYIDWDMSAAEKDEFEHFMMKEIMEQPSAINNTISYMIKDNEISLGSFELSAEYLKSLDKIYIVACGSAYHVGCVAKYVFEKIVKKATEVDVSSEFRYKDTIISENTLVISISQSGETADTLAAVRKAKQCNARVLSIVNVKGSSIANESHNVIYTLAGPEIAVATTKAYSTQLAVIYALALYMGKKLNTISNDEYENYLFDLKTLPQKIESILKNIEPIKTFAQKISNMKNAFFIGRNLDYAVSLEGSLKLKEISYINSEAYAAGELKHGSISLVEDDTLVVCTATLECLIDKMISNIKEVKARGAKIFGISTSNLKEMEEVSDFLVSVPNICDIMKPSLSVIPLQVFAYFVANSRGCDIDKPRNLAKSVTVE